MVNMFFNDGIDWVNFAAIVYPIDSIYITVLDTCGDVPPRKIWAVM